MKGRTLLKNQTGIGRPSAYTPEVLDEICSRLEQGQLLTEISELDHMPNWSTIHKWMEIDPAVSIRIACAREKGHDVIAENLTKFALDEFKSKTTKTTYKDGKEIIEVTEYNDAATKKLYLDVTAKLLGRWNRKKYGDQFIGDDNNINVTVQNMPTKQE